MAKRPPTPPNINPVTNPLETPAARAAPGEARSCHVSRCIDGTSECGVGKPWCVYVSVVAQSISADPTRSQR